MPFVLGYHIVARAYESRRSVIYRGRREKDNMPVLIKTLRNPRPDAGEIARITREYEALKILNSGHVEGVVLAHDLVMHQSRPSLIMQKFEGTSLRDIIARGKIGLRDSIEIGVKVAAILGDIHGRRIIHKDIRPSHILLDEGTGAVRIIGFGGSLQLAAETPSAANPGMLEGPFTYTSPEQTGRLGRTLDCRTDFYSLGIVLYEMLAGTPPFTGEDPLELIHGHIAREPRPLRDLNGNVPEIVSRIIMKLLSKNADDRYQSAHGLMADLGLCLRTLQDSGEIPIFSPGAKDFTTVFRLPQKLYGRERELALLLDNFERASRGRSSVMLVAGEPGIGKTALIQELQRPLMGRKGHLARGKSEQLKRGIPYFALIQAFRGIVRRLLSEDEDGMDVWKERFSDTFGANSGLMIGVIPEMELIMGKQPPAPDLHPAEARNRFNMVVEKFVRILSRKEHPLTICIDDMQWIDADSLRLIFNIITDPESSHLFFIGAYRDNEVDDGHPLMLMKSEAIKNGADIHEISLKPLSPEDMNQLASDALSCEPGKARPLSDLMARKTGGNPFFAGQFFKSLHDDGLIEADAAASIWKWDLRKIEDRGITNNVVEFMIGKISRLDGNAQRVLTAASCIGTMFDLRTLSMVNGKPLLETAAELRQAVSTGLIVPASDLGSNVFYLSEGPEEIILGADQPLYRFLHDRVQQAAYSMLAPEVKKKLHLTIGMLMLNAASGKEVEEKVFEITNQLNKGRELITSPGERVRLAELNLMAGRKARSSTAFTAAGGYLSTGIEVLPVGSWDSSYSLTFSLHLALSEAEYLCENSDRAEGLFDITLRHAKSDQDRADVHNMKMIVYNHIPKRRESFEAGLSGLRLMGIRLYPRMTKAAALAELVRAGYHLKIINTDNLLSLPQNNDEGVKRAMKLLINTAYSAYFIDPDLFIVIAMKVANLSMKRGNTDVSSVGYGGLGIVLGPVFGDFRTAYLLGEASLHLSEIFNNADIKSKAYFVFAAFLNHWQRHIRTSIPYLRKGMQYGEEAGDLVYFLNNFSLIIFSLTLQGERLDVVHEECGRYKGFSREKKDEVVSLIEATQQMASRLKGSEKDTEGPSLFDEKETERIEKIKVAGNTVLGHWYYYLKSLVLYINERFEDAYDISCRADRLKKNIIGFPQQWEHYFLHALIVAARIPHAGRGERVRAQMKLTSYLRKLKTWSKAAPENCLPRYLLVRAEKCRIKGNDNEAMKLYDQAIESARENGFIQVEAIANELAGRFHLSRGFRRMAAAYIGDARSCYSRWGASAKAIELDRRYFGIIASGSAGLMLHEAQGVAPDGPEALNMLAVVKASQAISGELILERLLERLMDVLIETSGARKGFLIREQGGTLGIEVARTEASGSAMVFPFKPLDSLHDVPRSVINYVKRTKKKVVLPEREDENRFSHDPYLLERRPLSALCMPLIKQGAITGLIYLENDIAPDIFSEKGMELLEILTSQMAISLDNAVLYNRMRELNKDMGERIAEREQAEESLHRLSKGILNAHEEERKRLSRELHDGLGQSLLAVRLNLQMAEAKAGECVPAVRETFPRLISDITHSLRELKEIAQDLRPSYLEDMNIGDALIWHARKLQEKTGVEIRVKVNGSIEPDRKTGDHIYRIYQEALSNAVRHSGATSVEVSLEQRAGRLHLEVADNGVGYDPSTGEGAASGLGISTMRERTELLRGKFTITGGPGKGTLVEIEAPG